MAENGTLEEVLGAGAGWARMLAAAGDVAGALNPVSGNGHGPDDWLDAWDPAYIRTTLPTLRAVLGRLPPRRGARASTTSRRRAPCCSWATTPAAR